MSNVSAHRPNWRFRRNHVWIVMGIPHLVREKYCSVCGSVAYDDCGPHNAKPTGSYPRCDCRAKPEHGEG